MEVVGEDASGQVRLLGDWPGTSGTGGVCGSDAWQKYTMRVRPIISSALRSGIGGMPNPFREWMVSCRGLACGVLTGCTGFPEDLVRRTAAARDSVQWTVHGQNLGVVPS